MPHTTPSNTADQREVLGNLALRDRAAVTGDAEEQMEIARHPSGLIRAALRANPNISEEALRILDAQQSSETISPEPNEKIDDISKKTQEALAEIG